MGGHRNLNNYSCSYSELTKSELEKMGASIEDAFMVQVELAEKKENVLSILLKDFNKDFTELDHLPTPDIYQKETGSQYFYHAHLKEDRVEHEHGHFHLFLDLKVVAPELVPEGYDKPRALTQVAAMSVTSAGSLFRLFTTNGWVTDNVFVPAEKLIPLLEKYSLAGVDRYEEVAIWVEGMMKTFIPHLKFLLKTRDEVIKEWQVEKAYKTFEEALEDRKLEIPSSIYVDVLDHANKIEDALS